MKLSALREQRAAKVEAMKALVDAAGKETRDLSADEAKQFDALKGEERAVSKQIERAEYLADTERRSAGTPISDNASADFDKLASQVSIVKTIRAQMEGRALDGAELEYAQEAERRSGRKAEGVFIPMQALEQRVNNTTSAPEIVGEQHRPQDYIGALRNKLLARKLGVRVLTGLQGDVSIPKHGSSMSLGWVTEGGAVNESTMGFDSVTMTPKHTGGKTEMSRQLIQQSSPGIEQLVRDDLTFLIAQQIDDAILNGTGLTGQPTGILENASIQTAPMPTSWADILALAEKLELENLDGTRFLSAPGVRTTLASTEKVTGAGSGFLAEGGMIDGKGYDTTNQMPTGTLLYGDFSQVMLGIWSEIDILVNPYAEPAYSRGGIQVRAMATCDVALRHPEAFVAASGA